MAFYHFLVLGEEKRQYYLAQMLKKEGHEVMEAMSYQPGYHDAILLPVPQTAMFFEENKEKFQKGQVVYGCKFPETAIDYAKERGIRVVDYYKEDGVAERNALATAEGAVSEALIHGCVSIQGSECLSLDMERVERHWRQNSANGGHPLLLWSGRRKRESGQKVMAIRLVPLMHQKIQCQNMILFLIPYRHRFLPKSGCRE